MQWGIFFVLLKGPCAAMKARCPIDVKKVENKLGKKY